MFIIPITFLILAIGVKNSLQSCSSTVAVTTCTWDSLKSPKPLQVEGYKTYLSFSKGNLDSVPNNAFKFFPYVTVLQLSNNKIKKLEDDSFKGLVELKNLNLYGNELTAINLNTLQHCSSLEKLDLGLNKITFIDEKAFEHLKSLKDLNLGFNSLKAIPLALNSLLNLQTLKLSNNVIEMVKPNAFSKLSNLKELYLNDNKLTNIEQNGFKGLTKLKSLDLRVNYLTDLDVADLVNDARNLNQISLSINEFKCASLQRILDSLRRSNVEVSRGVSKSPNNIIGISCKAL